MKKFKLLLIIAICLASNINNLFARGGIGGGRFGGAGFRGGSFRGGDFRGGEFRGGVGRFGYDGYGYRRNVGPWWGVGAGLGTAAVLADEAVGEATEDVYSPASPAYEEEDIY